MNREQIIESITELPSETRVKAWLFQVDKKFYHVATYDAYRQGTKTSIWESNKKGKRISPTHIYSIITSDHVKCINQFLDTLSEPETPVE